MLRTSKDKDDTYYGSMAFGNLLALPKECVYLDLDLLICELLTYLNDRLVADMMSCSRLNLLSTIILDKLKSNHSLLNKEAKPPSHPDKLSIGIPNSSLITPYHSLTIKY